MTETDQSETRMLQENLASSANAPKQLKVPPNAAYAFIQKNSKLQPSRNAMKCKFFLDIHSFIEI